jgi:hypothetical protein
MPRAVEMPHEVGLLRERLDRLEHELDEKNQEAARMHAGKMIELLDTLIDDIDEGRVKADRE